MEETSSNNKRVAKNTLFLYTRTIVIMCVNLYTSRVILDVLGIKDYGVYDVVGGFITMFSVFSASLSNAITRFITFQLGSNDEKRLSLVFSTSVNIQIIISLSIVFLAELAGVWFLNNKMNIPPDRMYAANWILQFSLITFVINLISLPYNASIVAHERMKVFAYIGLLEAFLKLGIVFLLLLSPMDKLITYGFLLMLVAMIIRLIYSQYCKRQFPECRYHFVLERPLLKKMAQFAGWNFFGTSAYLFNTHGVNILSNMFFDVTVNAARGVASQAGNAVLQFVNNFSVAINPQIIKTYAENNYEACFSTVRQGAKYSYFLMLLFFIPFVIETDFILHLWLKEVPEHAILFWQLTMLGTLVDLPGAPLTVLAQATGNIKRFYIYIGLLGCLVFPISYILFEMGYPPYSAYIAYVAVYTYLVYLRLYLMNRQIGFPIKSFLSQVIGRILPVTVISFPLPLFIHFQMEENFGRLLLVTIVSTVSIVVAVLSIGMSSQERNKVFLSIRQTINNKFRSKQ